MTLFTNFIFDLFLIITKIKCKKSNYQKLDLNSPATTVSARCNRTKTCSINPTSVQACKLRTLFRKIAINTLHISAWKERKKNVVKYKITIMTMMVIGEFSYKSNYMDVLITALFVALKSPFFIVYYNYKRAMQKHDKLVH